KIYLPDDATQAKSKLSISNFNNLGGQPVLIDNNNHKITFAPSAPTFTVLVPNGGSNNFCFLSSWANVNAASINLPITAVNGTGTFVNYLAQGNLDSAFVIISHPKLINAPSVGVNQYAAFRSSAIGGSYHTLVASINDLYDQFAYGVERNPISIKNFCGYLIANATATSIRPPSNLFLIGKGTHAWECVYQQAATAITAATCLVPSFGNPSSDVLLTEGLPGSTIFPEPAISTGRLSAQNDQEVLNYLSKAQLFVAQPADDIWKKTAIHFIGGNSSSDQQTFNSYMTYLKNIYEDVQVGGDVFSFYKTSTAPISINTNDSVALLINQGVSLMTFFGHGSPTGFDQNIDAPSTYNSAPKIPFIIANSCYTGDMFSVNDVTNSEEWVLAPNDKGAIGYIATTAEGVAQQLIVYTSELYNQFCKVNYGLSYGSNMKNAIKAIMTYTSGIPIDPVLQAETCMEMTLHGDPAIKGSTVPLPDYQITNADLIFDTQTYPTDSIGLKIVMTNVGKAVHGVYSVRIRRVFPNGDTTTLYKTVSAPLYKDTLSFFIFENYTKAVGVNNFSVDINYLHPIINEYNYHYANNSISSIPLFIRGSDIEPVWPYKYAIVPNIQKVTLKASTADAFALLTTYHFQMDTSASFNSPILTNTLVTAVGGVVTAPNLSLLNIDSVVYFWRVAKDEASPNWKQSSFQVIVGKYGWEQAHFFQFNHDGYQYVKQDSLNRMFTFVNNINTIGVKTAIIPSNNPPIPIGSHSFTDVQLYLNNGQVHLWSCGVDGWVIGIFDTISGKLIPSYTVAQAPNYTANAPTYYGNPKNCMCDGTSSTFDFGSENQCVDRPGNIPDPMDWRPNLKGLLDTLKPGTPVIAYTAKASYDNNIHSYPVVANGDLIQAFHSIGSTKIDSLINNDTTSLIIFGRKGWGPGNGHIAHEVLSHNQYELISLVDTLSTHFDNGFIASEIIGPAQKSDTAWKQLHWHFVHDIHDAVPSGDSIVLQLIG
ncbi:MAG: C25 family cysteine peptidase, partial [Bacteroidia bacterium]